MLVVNRRGSRVAWGHASFIISARHALGTFKYYRRSLPKYNGISCKESITRGGKTLKRSSEEEYLPPTAGNEFQLDEAIQAPHYFQHFPNKYEFAQRVATVKIAYASGRRIVPLPLSLGGQTTRLHPCTPKVISQTTTPAKPFYTLCQPL
ncbi:hypothetical protein ACJJTC_012520 [Scirpophaga incertulas]